MSQLYSSASLRMAAAVMMLGLLVGLSPLDPTKRGQEEPRVSARQSR